MRGREILERVAPDEAELLHGRYLPSADWTRFPVGGTWVHWSVRLLGKARGRPVIRVNRALQAPKSQVPDALLEYLLGTNCFTMCCRVEDMTRSSGGLSLSGPTSRALIMSLTR
jgi:hypothetical protein